MAFSPANLDALIQAIISTSGTTAPRIPATVVSAAGYFAPVAGSLRPAT